LLLGQLILLVLKEHSALVGFLFGEACCCRQLLILTWGFAGLSDAEVVIFKRLAIVIVHHLISNELLVFQVDLGGAILAAIV